MADKTINDLKKQISTKDEQIKKDNTIIAQKDKEINDLKNQIKTKDNQLNQNKTTITQKDKEINDLKNQITQNKTTIAQKEKEVNDIKGQINAKDNQLNQNKTIIAQKEKEINDIKGQINAKDNQLNQNKSIIAQKEKEINELKIQLTEKEKLFNTEKTQKTEKESKINELNKKLNESTNEIQKKLEEINKLKEEFNKIKTENENNIKSKDQELQKRGSKIKELENNIVEMEKIKEKNNSLESEIKQLKKVIIPNSSDKSLYDISLNFNSIKSIKEGWDIKFSELGLNLFNTNIKCRKIGIIGNKRVGKSYILSSLFDLPYSMTPINSNEKISIKFKEAKKKDEKRKHIEFIVFDSEGFNCPILKESKNNSESEIKNKEDDNNNQKEIKKDANGEINKIDNKNNNKEKNCNIPMGGEKNNNLSKSCYDLNNDDIEPIYDYNIEELKANKILTEDFIMHFIIECSDIVIAVVGLLFYSDQLLLKKVMEECIKYKKKYLYVIHNLQNIITKEQVEIYIRDILINSGLTYNLEEVIEINSSENLDEEENKEDSGENESYRFYFTGKYKSLNVNHYIFINDNSDEKVKLFYNELTKVKMNNVLNDTLPTEFNISKSLQNEIYELLKDYSKIQIKKENIQINDNNKENTKKILYTSNENLILRKNKINNEFIIQNESSPKYKIRKIEKDNKGKICIKIEAPGKIIDESINVNGYSKYLLQYKGKKCLYEDDEGEEEQKNISNNSIEKEYSEFKVEIPIHMQGYGISNLNEPKCHNNKGIEIIEYDLEKISNINILLENGNIKKNEK